MKKGVKFSACSIYFALAIVVVVVFIAVDGTVLGRVLRSFKDPDHSTDIETFQKSDDDGKPPYTNLSSVIMVAPSDMIKDVALTKNADQCKDSCTYEEKCMAFTFDSIKDNCKLLYDVTGYVRNKDALFTTKGGVKHRTYIGDHRPDRKYMRFEGMELPPEGKGKIATHQFVKSLDNCRTKCLEVNDLQSKCIAFEYDFKTKACTLNNEVAGKMVPNANKDSYLLIN